MPSYIIWYVVKRMYTSLVNERFQVRIQSEPPTFNLKWIFIQLNKYFDTLENLKPYLWYKSETPSPTDFYKYISCAEQTKNFSKVVCFFLLFLWGCKCKNEHLSTTISATTTKICSQHLNHCCNLKRAKKKTWPRTRVWTLILLLIEPIRFHLERIKVSQ